VAIAVVDLPKEVEVGDDDRQRPPQARGSLHLVRQGRVQVSNVVEASLRVEARLGAKSWDAQRTVDQGQWYCSHRGQPKALVPPCGYADCAEHEDEVGRKALEREEAGFA
jgi:hypothetical protein